MTRVVAGRLNKQVAAELDISEITVKAHRGHLMRKMGAESVADLVRMAARLGIGTAVASGAGVPRDAGGGRDSRPTA